MYTMYDVVMMVQTLIILRRLVSNGCTFIPITEPCSRTVPGTFLIYSTACSCFVTHSFLIHQQRYHQQIARYVLQHVVTIMISCRSPFTGRLEGCCLVMSRYVRYVWTPMYVFMNECIDLLIMIPVAANALSTGLLPLLVPGTRYLVSH